jgi:hypothetical protein
MLDTRLRSGAPQSMTQDQRVQAAENDVLLLGDRARVHRVEPILRAVVDHVNGAQGPVAYKRIARFMRVMGPQLPQPVKTLALASLRRSLSLPEVSNDARLNAASDLLQRVTDFANSASNDASTPAIDGLRREIATEYLKARASGLFYGGSRELALRANVAMGRSSGEASLSDVLNLFWVELLNAAAGPPPGQ